MLRKELNIKDDQKEIWINPIGSYGDILMLSGVLKQWSDINPQFQFYLVRRTIFTSLLNGHPAIKGIGHPPKNAYIIATDYWSKEKLGEGNQRPYQVLARLFGLLTPINEDLYLPGSYPEDRLLQDLIPTDANNITIIAPSTNSPRKTMEPSIWQVVVEKLKSMGMFVIQVGLKNDIYIKGAYSLLGLTTPHELISLLTRSNLIITVDNFIMHAAHMTGKPAIIIWGPTNSKIYGYPGQVHVQCSTDHCELRNKCLKPYFSDNYETKCPLNDSHCMSKVSIDKLINSVLNIVLHKMFDY